MISLLKKRRFQFTPKQLNQYDIERQQRLIDLQIMKTKSFWKDNAKRLHSNLYEEQKKIDIENHEDEFDAEDIIIIPKLNKKMVKVQDSPDTDENFVVLDESGEQKYAEKSNNVIVISTDQQAKKAKATNKLSLGPQFEKVNGNFVLNLDKNNEDLSDHMINETFQAIKNDGEEDEKKINDEHNTSQSFQNNTFIQNVLSERIQKIKEKQCLVDDNGGGNKQTNSKFLPNQNLLDNPHSFKQLPTFGQENKLPQFQVVSQLNFQEVSPSKYQVFSSNNLQQAPSTNFQAALSNNPISSTNNLAGPQINNQQGLSSHNLQVVSQNNLQALSSNNLQESNHFQYLPSFRT